MLEQLPGDSPCSGGVQLPVPLGWDVGVFLVCCGCLGVPRAALQPLFIVLGLPNALWVCN